MWCDQNHFRANPLQPLQNITIRFFNLRRSQVRIVDEFNGHEIGLGVENALKLTGTGRAGFSMKRNLIRKKPAPTGGTTNADILHGELCLWKALM